MKQQYNGYKFASSDNSVVPSPFDENKFNEFITKNDYVGAANYAAQYHFDDPEKEIQHRNSIINLRSEGRKLNAIYSRITRDEDLDAVKFIDNLYVGGGLDNFNDKNPNPYAAEYKEFLNNLGNKTNYIVNSNGDSVPKDITKASKLSITFQPEKQYGIFGWDWIAKDNELNIDNFYQASGLTEAQLKSAGVDISKDHGKTTLTFDKSNDLTNTILMNLQFNSTNPSAQGLYNYIFGYQGANPTVNGLNESGDKISQIDLSSIEYMQDKVASLTSRKKDLFSEIDSEYKTYSSTVAGYLDSNLILLDEAHRRGEIDDSTYKAQRKLQFGYLEDAIAGYAFTQYDEMYSNVSPENETITDETLNPIDDLSQRSLIQQYLSANIDNLNFQVMISNGKVGTLITLPSLEKKGIDERKDPNLDNLEENIARKKIQVFIPNFMPGQEASVINKDTMARASREINSMQDWGYDYKCQDGTKISIDIDGRAWSNGQEINIERAKQLINKDMVVEDTTNYLQFNFMNDDGEIYDKEEYETYAREAAVGAVTQMYPDIDLTDENGQSVYDALGNVNIDKIFNLRGAGSTILEKYSKNMNWQTKAKYTELFDIYNKIMKGLQNYN